MHLYCDFSMWRQMAPQQTKFRTAFFGQYFSFTSLRKDSVTSYECIWTLYSQSVKRTGCALQRTERFVVPSVGGATRFANLRQKFSKTQKNRPQSCAKFHMITIEIHVVIYSIGVMDVRVPISCRYALSLMGRCSVM